MKIKNLTLIFSAIAMAPLAAQANLISNGSFEDHSAFGNGSWQFFSSIPGWTAETDLIEVGHGGVYGVTGYDQKDVLELDANHNAKVSQTLNLTGGNYTISFEYAKRNGVDPLSAKLNVLWDNNTMLSLSPTMTSMKTASFMVHVPTAGSHKLSFQGEGISDSYGALVDNVQMNPVPEPASMAALGLGVLGIIRRRRQIKG